MLKYSRKNTTLSSSSDPGTSIATSTPSPNNPATPETSTTIAAQIAQEESYSISSTAYRHLEHQLHQQAEEIAQLKHQVQAYMQLFTDIKLSLQELATQQQQFHRQVLNAETTIKPGVTPPPVNGTQTKTHQSTSSDKRQHPEGTTGPSKRIITTHVRFSDAIETDEPMISDDHPKEQSKNLRGAHPPRLK